MRSYELMLVLSPDFAASDTKKLTELIKKTVGDGIAVKEVTVIGKKTLAYPIKKTTEGIYVLVNLQADRVNVAPIQKQMDLGNDILRFLLILKEE